MCVAVIRQTDEFIADNKISGKSRTLKQRLTFLLQSNTIQ